MGEEKWESYDFRITHFTNPYKELNALKGLSEIYKLIDLKNISRLTNYSESLTLALDVYEVIEKYAQSDDAKDVLDKDKSDQDGEGDEGEDSEEVSDEEFEQLLQQMLNQQGKGGKGKDGEGEESDGSDGAGGKPKRIKLTPEQLKKLMKTIQKTRDLGDGTTIKVGLNTETAAMVEAATSAQVDIKNCGGDKPNDKPSNSFNKSSKSNGAGGAATGYDVIVVKKFTESVASTNPLYFCCSNNSKLSIEKYLSNQ